MRLISIFPLWVIVILLLGSCLFCSWLLVSFVRRHKIYPVLKENNEFVGFTYAVYGLIYGVVLAFTIVTAWGNFSEAEHIVMNETTVLSELWRDANAFKPNIYLEIHNDLISYVNSVIELEWHEMAMYGRPHNETRAIYEDLWRNSYTIQPETKNQEAFLAEYLDRINELSATRRLRLLYSRSEINSVLWLVLLIGAFPTVTYSLLFFARHGWVQVTITAFLSGLVGLCLLVALSLQYPFSGRVSIDTESFKQLKQSFEQRAAEEIR